MVHRLVDVELVTGLVGAGFSKKMVVRAVKQCNNR
jgi:hypothetical protein